MFQGKKMAKIVHEIINSCNDADSVSLVRFFFFHNFQMACFNYHWIFVLVGSFVTAITASLSNSVVQYIFIQLDHIFQRKMTFIHKFFEHN